MMTTAAASTMREIDPLPEARPGRRAFWIGAGLVLALVLFSTLALQAYLGAAVQAQAAANSLLQQQIAAIDRALAESKHLQKKTADGLARLRAIELMQQRQTEDARLLRYLTHEISPAIQFAKIGRDGNTLLLQGSSPSRAQRMQLLRVLESGAFTNAPVLLESTQPAPGGKSLQAFKIAATLAPTEISPPANQSPPKKTADSAPEESAPASESVTTDVAWLLMVLLALIALGFGGYGIWRWRRPRQGASLFATVNALDPKQVGTWPRGIRLLVLLELALFATFFAWLFAIGPALEELENQRHSALQLQANLPAKQQAAANLDANRARFVAMEQQLAASMQRMPLKIDEAQLFVAIEQLAQAHGLAMAAPLTASPLAQEALYASHNLPLQLSGSLDAIHALVGGLQQLPQLLVLGDFELARMAHTNDPGHSGKGWRFDASLRALLAPDPAQAAKQKKKNKGRKE